MAGNLTAENVAVTRTEEEFNQVQERKRLQDLYLEKIQSQLEDIEQKAIEYQEQSSQLDEQTEELKRTVRHADAETERIRKERANLIQKWNNSVLGIAKRDQAIGSFTEAFKERKLELKRILSKVQTTQQDIIKYQEEHEHLSNIEIRTEKLSQAKEGQIKQTKDLIKDVTSDLDKASRAKFATLKTLKFTNDELRNVQDEVPEKSKPSGET